MKEKKQILVVARWPVGGIRTYFRYIYSANLFERYQFTFVMPNIEGAAELIESYLPQERYDLVLGEPDGKDLLRLATKTLKKREFDLIHSHGFTAGVLCLPLQWRFRLPHLMTTHDVFSEPNFSGLGGAIKRKVMALGLNLVTRVMPVGEDANRNMLEFFPSLVGRTSPIRNGIPTEYFSEGRPRNLKQELGLQPETFLIGFFGRFMAQKGFRYLVEAMQQMSQTHGCNQIRVVCFGWGGFIREEQDSLHEAGILDYFSFMPQTNNMPAAIKGVDLVAMPSLWEACPLLPMEVLSAGVPIVGTSCLGSREVFRDTPAYVVEPRSAKELANCFREEMKASSKQTFQDFSKTAVERFSSTKSASQLEQLYIDMI